MKFTPRPTACVAAVLLVIVAVGAAPAQDNRPTLPNDLYASTTPFTADQQRTVQAYADYYINILVTGSDSQVVEARAQLVAPLGRGGAAEFNQQYSAVLAQRLAASPAMQSQRQPFPPDNPDAREQRGGVVVRLNTMIVMSRLNKDEAAMSLVLRGLQDEHPAVRYWAVRSVRAGTEGLAGQQRQQLVAALQRMVAGEQADEVVRVLLATLVDLNAVDVVIAALNDLVALHVNKPRLTFDAKLEAMRALLRKLEELLAQNQAVQPQFRQFARAAGRYMLLITQQAQAAELDPTTIDDHVEMVRWCDTVLRRAHQVLGAGGAQPASIQAALAGKNWPALQVAAVNWREILKQPPFNFTDADLAANGAE